MSSYKRCNIAKTGQQIFELFVGNNKFFRISLLKSIKCKVVSTLTVSDVLIISKLNVQSKKMLQATNYYERAYGATVQKSV